MEPRRLASVMMGQVSATSATEGRTWPRSAAVGATDPCWRAASAVVDMLTDLLLSAPVGPVAQRSRLTGRRS